MNIIFNKIKYISENLKNSFRKYFFNVKKYLWKDKYVFGNKGQKKIIEGTVNLHYWSLKNGEDNLGDYLSKIIFEWMLSQNNIENKVKKTKHLYSVGSILGFGYQDAVIWGSGILEENNELKNRMKHAHLDIRCLRGPLTRKLLIDWGICDEKTPEIYGDPAVLMPLIYKPEKTIKKYDYVVIPHFSKYETQKNLNNKDNIKVINMKTINFEKVITEIVSAKVVISSSLHGIILAESYGIPAIYVKTGNSFKYRDWYYSTGRKNIKSVTSVEEAYTIVPMTLPNVTSLQKNLLQSFPKDLWQKR